MRHTIEGQHGALLSVELEASEAVIADVGTLGAPCLARVALAREGCPLRTEADDAAEFPRREWFAARPAGTR